MATRRPLPALAVLAVLLLMLAAGCSAPLKSQGARSEYSAGTLRVMRAAVLYREGLYQEVRRDLEAVAGSDDPTIHTLLGHVYERVGSAGGPRADADRAEIGAGLAPTQPQTFCPRTPGRRASPAAQGVVESLVREG